MVKSVYEKKLYERRMLSPNNIDISGDISLYKSLKIYMHNRKMPGQRYFIDIFNTNVQ